MYFTNAYTAAPVSSPTRASIITGRYPAELKLTCHIPGVGMRKYVDMMNSNFKLKEAYFVDHIPLGTPTLASVAKVAGYNTIYLGKWHIAGEGSQTTSDGVVNPEWHPNNYGFDINIGGCAYGQPASYFSPYMNATIKDRQDKEYLTDRLGDEAIKYIKKNNFSETDKPFFIYLSFYAVHTPYQVPEKELAKNNGNKYHALIEKMDQNVGRILKVLDDENLTDNTIVIFYSDNGGVTQNPPLNDCKGSLHEGGIRVPMIVRWPKIVDAGSICNVPVTSVDFMPTFTEIMEINNSDIKSSGKSIIPLLNGRSLDNNDRPIYWHYPHNRSGVKNSMAAAIREGDWKLIYSFETKKYSLYNLTQDISEKNNLVSVYPDKAKNLFEKLCHWQHSINAEMPVE